MTFRSEKWRRAVASLECCVICGKYGVQVAHRNQSKGMGLKTSDCLTAPLCPEHHYEIDNGKNLTRDERRKMLDDAILRTIEILCERGLVTVTGRKAA